jgi:hypothetical protein
MNISPGSTWADGANHGLASSGHPVSVVVVGYRRVGNRLCKERETLEDTTR